ncbi:PASTA domain-containing protein [Frankia sp. AgB1.9]|uniref:PASTA domain-containing protein n=1 Tax=unclassified Frankia TaxID=2632575 RepID=UPI00193253AC|nr:MULTISPECIES: PASTA domain-containing protein [unclassified Frankia]MBL7547385.1 PASTA domain-containing protein [Frankia sp. AgB1.9]MBL7618693.1 PASTA domain-containing protein [Frankia sp. AgB1.8]
MVAIVLVSCIAAIATPGSKKVTVPNAVGLSLSAAEARLEPNLKATSVDATGQGRMQLVDSNWQVVSQDPPAGTAVSKGATITLNVLKPGESPAVSVIPDSVSSSAAPNLAAIPTTQAPIVASHTPVAAPTTRHVNPPQATYNPPPANDPQTARAPDPAPAPVTQDPVLAGCHPTTSKGNCYKAGQLCPAAYHEQSGIAGNGEPIVCQDNNGWRWEPA